MRRQGRDVRHGKGRRATVRGSGGRGCKRPRGGFCHGSSSSSFGSKELMTGRISSDFVLLMPKRLLSYKTPPQLTGTSMHWFYLGFEPSKPKSDSLQAGLNWPSTAIHHEAQRWSATNPNKIPAHPNLPASSHVQPPLCAVKKPIQAGPTVHTCTAARGIW